MKFAGAFCVKERVEISAFAIGTLVWIYRIIIASYLSLAPARRRPKSTEDAALEILLALI